MFNEKVVWITGASSGIGAALASEFAMRGANLILSGRREDALSEVREQCLGLGRTPDSILVLPFDIADETAIPAAVQQAQEFKGRIDLLINNAGISQRSSALDTQMSTYRRLFEVDFFGQIGLTREVLPIMLEQGNGHIAVTSSVAGKIGVPFRTGYCAAKHAVMGYFDALRTEVSHRNIQVTTITPGFIRTQISENALHGDGSAFGKTDTSIAGGMEVEECAKVILKGFEKGKQEIPVGVGMEMHALRIKRFFPNTLLKMMNRQYRKMAKSNYFED
jgi:short-subunit dehydrogenase